MPLLIVHMLILKHFILLLKRRIIPCNLELNENNYFIVADFIQEMCQTKTRIGMWEDGDEYSGT